MTFHKPQVVEGITHLGYPLHFVILLGIWKVLGGVAILLPGFALLKEWAPDSLEPFGDELLGGIRPQPGELREFVRDLQR